MRRVNLIEVISSHRIDQVKQDDENKESSQIAKPLRNNYTKMLGHIKIILDNANMNTDIALYLRSEC